MAAPLKPVCLPYPKDRLKAESNRCNCCRAAWCVLVPSNGWRGWAGAFCCLAAHQGVIATLRWVKWLQQSMGVMSKREPRECFVSYTECSPSEGRTSCGWFLSGRQEPIFLPVPVTWESPKLQFSSCLNKDSTTRIGFAFSPLHPFSLLPSSVSCFVRP